MAPKDDSPNTNPEPCPPSDSIGEGTPEPAPEPIVIPPFDVVTYSEPELGTSIVIDVNIKTEDGLRRP